MEVLSKAFAGILIVSCASCYEPALRDCTVACEHLGDCAEGQVCAPGGMCAASAATTCERIARPDAGHDETDAPDPPRDAAIDAPAVAIDAPIDAPIDAAVVIVTIHLTIQGMGTVSDGAMMCMAPSCDFMVPEGVPTTLSAMPPGKLDKWSLGCSGNAPTCTLTPVQPLSFVNAKFKGGPDDVDEVRDLPLSRGLL